VEGFHQVVSCLLATHLVALFHPGEDVAGRIAGKALVALCPDAHRRLTVPMKRAAVNVVAATHVLAFPQFGLHDFAQIHPAADAFKVDCHISGLL